MRTIALLLICGWIFGASAAAPFDALECWTLTDSVAYAEVGADTINLGGWVSAFTLSTFSADTTLLISFTAVDDATAIGEYFPIAKKSSITTSAASASLTACTAIYAAWEDSASVNDMVHLICWGRRQ